MLLHVKCFLSVVGWDRVGTRRNRGLGTANGDIAYPVQPQKIGSLRIVYPTPCQRFYIVI